MRTLFKHGSIQVRTQKEGETVAESHLFLSGDINLSISQQALNMGWDTELQDHIKQQMQTIEHVWLLPYALLGAAGQITTLLLYKEEGIGLLQMVWKWASYHHQ